MNKFKNWWNFGGEEKTKKIIGQICIVILIAIIMSSIVAIIHVGGWSIKTILWGAVGVILFFLIVLGAVFWGDKK